MRFFVICIIAMTFLSGSIAANAEETLVLLSLRSKGYKEVVDSARKACDSSFREVYVNETPDIDIVRLVQESRAKVVFAVGDKAFRIATASLSRTPVIGALTLAAGPGSRNVKTIPYQAQPEQYLSLMNQMGRHKVGVLYGEHMSSYIKKADQLAKSYGITLEKRKVEGPHNVVSALSSLVGIVDALWVLPDSSVVSQETVEVLFSFTSASNIPAIIFSKNYLKIGAAVALEPERASIGLQAGNNICEILDGNRKPSNGRFSYNIFTIQSNPVMLKKLGISPP